MRLQHTIAAVTVIALLLGSQLPILAQNHENDTTHDQNMAWWKNQRFGMFIHWGPIAQKGVEISWSRGKQVPTATYDTLYKTFNPTGFDAGQWVKIAQDAGMKYLVFVAKHHDGFCLFNSALTDYKITSSKCPFGRDVTKELADSCRKAGLGIGLYYSTPDWYVGNNKTAQYWEYYTNQVVDELLTNYGRIETLWWDLGPTGANRDTLLNRMRKKQPWVLVNNRGDFKEGNYYTDIGYGDYITPEQKLGAFDTLNPWESCMTIDGMNQWAWNPKGGVKPLKRLIDMIVQTASGGGNCLLNVGPRPDGIIDPAMVTRLRQIGDFMKKCGESIYYTQGGPVPPGTWGGMTHRDDTIYVHLKPFVKTVTIPAIQSTIVSATCLTGGTPTVSQNSKGVTISLPAQDIDSIYTVIKLITSPTTGVNDRCVSPAPARPLAFSNGFLTYRLSHGAPVRLDIFNAQGRKLGSSSNGFCAAGDHAFDVRRFAKGASLLLVRLKVGNAVSTQKIIVAR